MTEKGIFAKLCRVQLISLSDRHGKRRNFSNYKSLELHQQLNSSIDDKRDLKISVSLVLLENCYFFQREEDHIGLGSSCCVLSNINCAYQHWETIFHDIQNGLVSLKSHWVIAMKAAYKEGYKFVGDVYKCAAQSDVSDVFMRWNLGLSAASSKSPALGGSTFKLRRAGATKAERGKPVVCGRQRMKWHI